MRLLVIANIPPFVTGGAEIQARLLAEQFLKAGHDVTIAAHNIPSTKLPIGNHYIQLLNIRVANWSRLTRGITFAASLSWLLVSRRRQFDIFYCRFVREAAITISILKWFFPLSAALIVCGEGTGKTGDADFIRSLPFVKLLATCLNRSCSAINVISPTVEDEFIKLGLDKSKFTYIPNGINVAENKVIKSQHDTKSFIFVGRLIEQKGLSYLLEAFSDLLKTKQAVHLNIIGDGPDKYDLKRLCHLLGIEKYVTFHGLLNNEDIPAYLATQDIFILPSLYEGFPISMLEAMAACLPVIVTKSGGPEYFVDNDVGLVCRPKDTASLRAAMLDMLARGDAELLQMGRRAREKVISRYNIRDVAAQYLQLFKKCLKSHHKPHVKL